jgi:hypothetical protein
MSFSLQFIIYLIEYPDNQIDSAVDVMVQAFGGSLLLAPMVGGDMSLSPALFRAYITATVVDGEAYIAEEMGDVIGVALWHGPGKGFLRR